MKPWLVVGAYVACAVWLAEARDFDALGAAAGDGSNVDTTGKVHGSDTPFIAPGSGSNDNETPAASGGAVLEAGEVASSGSAAAELHDNGYLADILTKDNFTTWWTPSKVYTYEGLAVAAKDFFDSKFLAEEAPEDRKREFAAFISHALAETSLQRTETDKPIITVDGKENKYCDRTYVSCANGKSYHGRGPMLLTGNENYARCSKALGLNNLLLTDPDRVATDSKIAWGSAIWMWMHDDGLGNLQSFAKKDFASSTALFKGRVECGPTPLKKTGDNYRTQIYNTTCNLLQIQPDENMHCSDIAISTDEAPNPDEVDSSKAVKQFLSAELFKELFPEATDLYSYEELVKAAAYYPEFASTMVEDASNARELAAFLAQAAAATDNFKVRVANYADRYNEDVFCDSGAGDCLDGRSYHGRGPFMTEWNWMYSRLADDLSVDLFKNPDLLAKDPTVAWRVAMHSWMVDLGHGRPHDYAPDADLLARASNILFGTRVCGSSPREKGADKLRIDTYKTILKAMEVEVIDEKTLLCATVAYDESKDTTGLSRYFSEKDFAKFFSDASPHYSYPTLLEATKMFPKFAGEDDEVSNKLEIAAFLAHASVGSRKFKALEMENGALYMPEDFCDRNVTDCVANKRYHGRGPFAVAWNYNYQKCGAFIDVDLLQHPEYVYLDSMISWKAALWYWMEHRPLTSYGTLHSVMHRHLDTFEENFRQSTIMVAGQQACGSDSEMQRVQLYNDISEHLKIARGDETQLKCQKVSADTAASDAAVTSQVASVLTKVNFYDITGSGASAPLYDYSALLYAANVFPAFAGAAEEKMNRREVAAFLTQVSIATDNFQKVEDEEAALKCTQPPCYYKRGPLMVEGDETYAKIRRAIDKNIIQEPGLLGRDSDAAWQSALYIWMSDNGNGSIHDYVRLSDYGFASSLKLLSPELCEDADKADTIQERTKKYQDICKILGVEPEEVLSCQDQKFLDYDPASVESAAGTGGLANILSKDLFVELFPDADPLYTYNAMLDAAAKFPKFANDGPDRQNRQEVAAFVAQMAHASGNFTFTQQSGWSLFEPSEYCDKNSNYTCNKEKRYHGRGPIQMTWNYNYGSYGQVVGVDLLNNPDWVATDSKIAWGSAIWYWMLNQGGTRGSIHDVFVSGTNKNNDYDYAKTTWLLNGGLECGSKPVAPEPERQRIRFYNRYAARFHVEPGTKLSCQTSDYEPQA
ncbi:hypothetical protein Poli38472_009243 [Pythium oligandrum]|uniref:Glycoside hydrolase family 19 catalytic domain-containing protein n=1 Tax=Pythium oligandrum TaxID=41045 RepID=A0A8K1CK33_PYTOL|nr:hypothetical protein Poli38472_009243 [Pythium oligandrum]|eukprot:TMW65076.1 hypothetical protein Poli38472_009243 [Pythium oligandrum]